MLVRNTFAEGVTGTGVRSTVASATPSADWISVVPRSDRNKMSNGASLFDSGVVKRRGIERRLVGSVLCLCRGGAGKGGV